MNKKEVIEKIKAILAKDKRYQDANIKVKFKKKDKERE